ncbi:hypothetical protein CA54_09800 [Symmachiella macrocystis]|uniref:Uncharacterized protein n=1 Tax=Symmachiella macrocystis TaxID=2527985 RepID=A0A5C6BK96_9PLAN|nr:hypothetical protein [Symmachiella macrocystis]TWU12162.1 hypothetical protein CA54_09800 [Symmachiella macrocystis]
MKLTPTSTDPLKDVLTVSVAFLVLMFGFLFSAGAEAFYGVKQPIFEIVGGTVLGSGVAVCLYKLVLYLRRSKLNKLSVALVTMIVLFDVAAIPFGIWINH